MSITVLYVYINDSSSMETINLDVKTLAKTVMYGQLNQSCLKSSQFSQPQ